MRGAWIFPAVALLVAGVFGGCAGDDPHADDLSPSSSDAGSSRFQPGRRPTLPDAGQGPVEGDFAWEIPEWFPVPVVPEDNPMSRPKVELGRHLFYDKRLSGNQTQSCASCHEQGRAFTEPRATSVGSTGTSIRATPWRSPTSATWPRSRGPTRCSGRWAAGGHPLFAASPVELGMRNREGELIERLRAEPRYQSLFPRSFSSDEDPFTVANLVKAIAAFERTLVSANAPFDRFLYGGEADAIGEDAKRGGALFNSERLECFHCHNGFALMDSVNYRGKSAVEFRFHNTGLYNVGGTGAYPAPNRGVLEVTGVPEDMGRFRAQSLRNIAVTAPYMHDGSIATLSEVLDHYGAAGRTIAAGPHAGVGASSPFKSSLVVGFELTADERADVLAFLNAFTDREFLENPKFADPWAQPCPLCE